MNVRQGSTHIIAKSGKSSLATVAALACLPGCDALVSPEYVGESRLHLQIEVRNAGTTSSAKSAGERIVPALAYSSGGYIYFSPAEVRGDFPRFDLDLFSEPGSKREQTFDSLAPNSHIAQLYIGAAPRNRLRDPLNLLMDRPLNPDCWDGNCDSGPGNREPAALCDAGGCDAPEPECTDTGCTISLSPVGPLVREEYADFVGFAEGYVVLFSREPLAAGSWGAQRVGAPEGLPAGYHLAKITEPDPEAEDASADCYARASTEVLEQYNAAHGTQYGYNTLNCLFAGVLLECGPHDLPGATAAKELPARLAAAQLEHGCLSLAPELEIVEAPEAEPIVIRLGNWFPGQSAEVTP